MQKKPIFVFNFEPHYLLITCVGAKEFLTVLAATLNTRSDLLLAAGTAKTTFARYERRGNCSWW